MKNNQMSFFEQLERRIQAINSLLCVGIDPHQAELAEPSVAAARTFCTNLIIPKDVPIVLDAKRGDIGSTSQAYAETCYRIAGSVTVSPYLGGDSLEPFLEDPSKAPWCLCKTSNPGSNDLQSIEVDGPNGKEPLYMLVARLSQTWGVRGLVVGATDVVALKTIRAEFEDVWFLSPGIGVQGGDLQAALQAGLNATKTGMLLPISRGISRAPDMKAKATEFRDLINAQRSS
eukprot:GEMP01054521.1.p1 GENE.GEMP01054521.1~~GEMP01054521.1.p1  ORF type:complete len:231 (+),score=44.54 GEMP01054521.1:77-769(+)